MEYRVIVCVSLVAAVWISRCQGDEPITYQMEEAQQAVLPCVIPDVGTSMVMWRSPQGLILTSGTDVITYDRRIRAYQQQPGQWVLQIDDVTLIDQGVYVCYTNSIPIKRRTVKLEVDTKETYMLMSAKDGFYRVTVRSDKITDYHLLVPGKGVMRDIRCMAFDPNQRSIYWVKREAVYGVQENGTDIVQLTDGPRRKFKVDGIDVDPYARVLYWARQYKGGSIGAKRLDKPDEPAYVIIGPRKKFKPESIVVYPEKGVMFFTNMHQPSQIEKACLDGSGHTVILKGSLGTPQSLTIDKTVDKLYWLEARQQRIEMSDLRGRDRFVVVRTEKLHKLSYPMPVQGYEGPKILRQRGLTIKDKSLYWIDLEHNVIQHVHSHDNRGNSTISTPPSSPVYNLVDSRYSQPLSWHPCHRNNGGCSHICFLNLNKQRQCACPTGMTMKSDTETCFYPSCKSNQHRCDSGATKCYDLSKRCDRTNDCEDGSDEKDCHYCYNDKFTCLNGKCIHKNYVCDQRYDCRDGSDEANCTISNSSMDKEGEEESSKNKLRNKYESTVDKIRQGKVYKLTAKNSGPDDKVNKVRKDSVKYNDDIDDRKYGPKIKASRCQPCRNSPPFESIVRQFCSADVVMKVPVVSMREMPGLVRLKLFKRKKRFYKHSGLSRSQAKKLVAVIKGDIRCTCMTINTVKRSKYFLMGRREGDQMVITYGHPWNYHKDLQFRRAIKAIKKRKYLCM